MGTAFVAVIDDSSAGTRAVLLAAGASAVLSWPELSSASQPDDVATVLFDATGLAELADHADPEGRPVPGSNADLAAALSALAQLDGESLSAAGVAGAVVVTTRQVTDTLKLVDAEGMLTRTADREDHRFVGTPIAARWRVLRSVVGVGPDPVAVLIALADRGVTVIGTSG